MPTLPWDGAPKRASCGPNPLSKRSPMLKRIAVFAVLVLGYVLTGVALSAGTNHGAPPIVSASE
ncbi:unknown protein [Azorhizobium caulinodans ORS 571]|uniref:Uncharacterized protein n=1 Tax=Azorhizobium caulinodans (strain ATCC 43989 / DSM 5975 / JCM 20966 / LMG 6465 / NBRC 14845 / NCIMB 13405 / ORS 571) TaxID=438753 RepID=A8IM11_AZOC5|nr:unknown protein [Azorhizobium caulinodans ORS 571]